MVAYYRSAEAAAEGMRFHLDAANTLALDSALPGPDVRRQISYHLESYDRAAMELARLEMRARRATESLRSNLEL